MSHRGRRAGGHAAMAPALLVLLGAVLWGTTGTAQALGPAETTPAAVGATRVALGGTALLLLAAARGELGPQVWRGAPRGGTALVVGIIAIAGYQGAFFAGVDRAGVALGTAVAIGSVPVWTGIVARLARGERPEPGWGTATALAVAGSALLLLPQGAARVDALGIGLALLAGLAFGVGTVAMKVLLDGGGGPVGVVGVVFAGGAVLLAPVLVASDLSWLATPRGMAMVAFLGLVATTLAYVVFSTGLRGVAAGTAATLSLAEPLTAGALGMLLLREQPGPLGLLGGGLVLTGLVVLSLRRRQRAPTTDPVAAPT